MFIKTTVSKSSEEPKMTIVGNCPVCGGPIYAGPNASGGTPKNQYSCDCRKNEVKGNSSNFVKYGNG